MNSIKVIDEDMNNLCDAINSIAAISEENTAATQEVTSTIQNQSESNYFMNSLAENLNDKANKESKLNSKESLIFNGFFCCSEKGQKVGLKIINTKKY